MAPVCGACHGQWRFYVGAGGTGPQIFNWFYS